MISHWNATQNPKLETQNFNWHDFLVFRVAIVRVLFLYICTARKKPFLDPCHPVCPENIPGVGSTFQIV